MKLICKTCGEEITMSMMFRDDLSSGTHDQPLCMTCLMKQCGGVWDENADPDPEKIKEFPFLANKKGRWFGRDGMDMKDVMEKVYHCLKTLTLPSGNHGLSDDMGDGR